MLERLGLLLFTAIFLTGGWGQARNGQRVNFMKNVSLTGAALYIAAGG